MLITSFSSSAQPAGVPEGQERSAPIAETKIRRRGGKPARSARNPQLRQKSSSGVPSGSG
jgi:hypothetical protein